MDRKLASNEEALMVPPGRLEFSFSYGPDGKPPERRSDSNPKAVWIASCFSGYGEEVRQLERLPTRRLSVERLGDVMGSWGTSIAVAPLWAEGSSSEIRPSEVEDLHPDTLLESFEPLSELQQARKDIGTGKVAAERVRRLLGSGAPAEAPLREAAVSTDEPVASSRSAESESDTLQRLLGGRSSSSAGSAAAAKAKGVQGLVQSLAEKSLAGSIVLPPDASDEALATVAEQELVRRLRALLEQPSYARTLACYQSMEALVRCCPDDTQVHFHSMDASFYELASNLDALGHALKEGRPSILLVDHVVRPTEQDMASMAGLLGVCAEHGVILALGAHESLAGCDSVAAQPDPDQWVPMDHVQKRWSPVAAEIWQRVQLAREAGAKLVLTLPRCLLRQPYGGRGEPLDDLKFDELAVGGHEAFAWGNGAYLAVRALCEVWCGARPMADGSCEINEQPVVTVHSDHGIRVQPHAEAWLSERAVARLCQQGFTVLQGVRDTDRVRVHF